MRLPFREPVAVRTLVYRDLFFLGVAPWEGMVSSPIAGRTSSVLDGIQKDWSLATTGELTGGALDLSYGRMCSIGLAKRGWTVTGICAVEWGVEDETAFVVGDMRNLKDAPGIGSDFDLIFAFEGVQELDPSKFSGMGGEGDVVETYSNCDLLSSIVQDDTSGERKASILGQNISSMKAKESSLLSKVEIKRSSFLSHISNLAFGTIATNLLPNPIRAIDFVPASPSFSGTYEDAMDILNAQRIAVDNIYDVVNDGILDEAGFKVMQLNAQTQTAGKIVLDTLQERMSRKDGVALLWYLSCQKKFVNLLDKCEECDMALQSAMKGKYGVTAAAQVKILGAVEETKSAFDDFLSDLKLADGTIDNRGSNIG